MPQITLKHCKWKRIHTNPGEETTLDYPGIPNTSGTVTASSKEGGGSTSKESFPAEDPIRVDCHNWSEVWIHWNNSNGVQIAFEYSWAQEKHQSIRSIVNAMNDIRAPNAIPFSPPSTLSVHGAGSILPLEITAVNGPMRPIGPS